MQFTLFAILRCVGGRNMDNKYNYSWQDNEDDKKKKKDGKRITAFSVICLAILFGVLASASFTLTNMLSERLIGTECVNSQEAAEIDYELVNEDSAYGYGELEEEANLQARQGTKVIVSDVSDIVEMTMPSIVSISNMGIQQVRDFFGDIHSQEVEGAGTGIIVDINQEELLVVTNAHVIEGSETLAVTFIDGAILEAMVKGVNLGYDLAVLAIPIESIAGETLDAISVAIIGDSDNLRMGEPAIAIGNSLGYGQTVTKGVISAVNRVSQAPAFDSFAMGMYDDVELIQTDAAINPGNSGGPLMNYRGEVIGINSSKLVGMSIEGVGYAIPISDVTDIIDELMNRVTRGRVSEEDRGFLGIFGETVTAEEVDAEGFPRGVRVVEVIDGSPALEAGLREGDIITRLDEGTVTSMVQLQSDLQFYNVGETVILTVQTPLREGGFEEVLLEVTLGPRMVR